MACKQLSEFEKAQIVAYNHCELPLGDIAKKLNRHHFVVYSHNKYAYTHIYMFMQDTY